MALTIKEQLDIISGVVTPNDSTYTLTDIVDQVAYNFAQDFISNQIIIDPQVYPDAWIYQDKMLIISYQILKSTSNYLFPLTKAIVARGADSGTYAQVADLNTDGWETFVSNNIEFALEQIATVKPHEKTEYNSIP